MPRPDPPHSTRGLVLRGVGLAVALGLGALAVWLIVTGTSQKPLRLGVLAGVWGALIGAWVIAGNRRGQASVEPVVLVAEDAPAVSTALAVQLRTSAELDRAEDAAASRAFETRLENMLRREIHSTLSREVASLRDEIAELRSELVDKVDGQLRLERIETTRVIGSDLEALQHEIRQLKFATQDGEYVTTTTRTSEPAPARPVVEPARIRPVSRETAAVEADIQPAAATEETMRIPPVPATPRPAPAPGGDDFAALPRIRPFTEFELDPIEDVPAAGFGEEDSDYTGRRRRREESEPGTEGRHSVSAEGDVAPERSAGRRHSRSTDADDLLARLLERENVRR